MDKNRDKIRDLAYRICDSNPKLHDAKSCDECPCSLGCITQYFANRAYNELHKIVNTHYIVLYEYATTSNGVYSENRHVVLATHDKDKAIEKMLEASAEERAYAEANDWIFYTNTETEIDAGEVGNYGGEHFKYTLVEYEEDDV